MDTVKSLDDLISANNNWMLNYMSINPGSNEIVNYMISEKTLKTEFSCATGNKCQKLQKDCKDPECEELRMFLLCFSCDRIFHQRCANVADADLTDEKTPWICFECIKDPLNENASSFFKSGGVKLFLKDRLEKFTTEIELSSPLRGKSLDEINQDYHDSFFDLSEIEKSLHIKFGDLQPINVSRLLGTKLINQQEEVEQMKRLMLKSEQEKLDLKYQLAQKSQENAKLRQLEQTRDAKSARVMHNPPQLSSTLVMNHPSHQTCLNSTTFQVPGTSNTLRQSHVEESASKMKELSYSIKVLTANDLMEQIARELNQQTSSATNNANNSSVHIVPSNFSSYSLPINENPSEPLSLRDIRKSLPKIDKFDGNVDKWLTFERAVERNVREGQYTDSLAKNIIRQALTGQPLERIDSIYNYSTASEIMNYLRISYGCSNNIVASARNKLMALKLAKPLTHSSAMEVTTKITSYMAACKYAQLPVLDMSISMHIHSQLDLLHQQQYYRYFYEKYPGMTRTERLDAQFEFLNELANTLPMGEIKNQDKKDSGKNFSVFSTSFGSPKNEAHTMSSNFKFEIKDNKNKKDDFKYEIRNKDKAPYLGYDIEKVNLLKKKCEFCNKLNHYSLECSEYRVMPMDQRYNAVKSRGLCMNCLLTTEHISSECTLKLGCGHNLDNYGKCSQKHHITLHRGRSFNRNSRRRFTYNRNNSGERDSLPPEDPQTPSAPEAENVSSSPSTTQQPATSQENNNQYRGYTAGTVSLLQPTENPPKGFRLCNTCSHRLPESSQRTIKLFNTYFYGNEKKAIGYAIGDSAAEITLVKRQLVDELGIVGQPCTIELLWTDSEVKTRKAIKVDLKISGILPDSELLTLKECYAIDDFNLSPRSLNVEKLKKQFPYLKDIPFDSYFDAIPCVLIGSRDAHMIEAIEPITQGGNCKPVALKSKLGFTIYGGAPESHESDSYEIQAVESQNIKYGKFDEITNKQLEETTLDEMKAIDTLKEDIKEGTIEVPLVRNRDLRKNIPQLINNFPLALQRQLAIEARLKRHPKLREACIRNFKQLIDETYVRAATYEDMKLQLHHLAKNRNNLRQAWERAKIINIYKSKDNRSRVADIQMPDGTIRKRRSVNRLAKLNLQKLACLVMIYTQITFMNYSQNASVLYVYASYQILRSSLIFSDLNMTIEVTITNPAIDKTKDVFFPVVQVSPIPVDIKISRLLLDISQHARDIIGIMRVADYKAKRQTETVFLYCINRSSAELLESIKLEYNNQLVIPTIVHMKVGRATFIDKNFEKSFDGLPISIIIKGLERQQEMTIYYVMELAKYFEKLGVVTGIRLGFNDKRNWSNTHGFVTFLRQADARSSSGEGGYVDHMILGRKIRASLSENIPMLVSYEHFDKFENGIVKWNEEAEAINELVTTFEFPMHLAENQKVKKNKFLENLHKKYENVEFPKYSSDYTRKNIYVPYSKKRTSLADTIESPKPSSESPTKTTSSKRAKLLESIESPKSSECIPQASTSTKYNNIPEERDSPESPFEDILSDSDEEVLQIELEADKNLE